MYSFDMFAELSQNSFDRIEEMIEYSPYAIDVCIRRFNYHPAHVPANPAAGVPGDPYGYEVAGRKNKPISIPNTETDFPIQTKCVIIYTPERRFLKTVGIFWDETKGDTLPIIGFFKDSDNIQKEDIILIDTFDTGVFVKADLIQRKLKVVDILTKGNMYSFVKIYRLAPFRDKL